MESSLFYELTLALVLAAIVALLFRALRQPVIIGYIVAGVLMGPSLFNLIHDHKAFESFSQIGVALLLFIIGLGLNTSVIKRTGGPVLVTFSAITLVVGGISFGVARGLGFSQPESILIGTCLLFSSTIVVIKALTDKKEQTRLYGQIAIGITLVEDVAATIALVAVSSLAPGGGATPDAFHLMTRGVALAVGLVLAGRYLMPAVTKRIADNQEVLVLFAITWGLGVASIFRLSGFSIEVGALFAGVALAHLPYTQGISTRLKPLRDFFVILFFIQLGSNLTLPHLSDAIVPALVFSALVIILKPLSILGSLGVLGYTKQTGLKVAVHISQISEFSIVLVVLAVTTGLAQTGLPAVITLTAMITILVSTYLMRYDAAIYRLIKGPLAIFERPETKREVKSLHDYPLVLFGYRKGGHEIVKTYRDMAKRYVVVDYDPEVVEVMAHQRINHLYGDATDLELLDEIRIDKSELVMSTISDLDTNLLLIKHLQSHNQTAIFICPAASYDDAVQLYELGASYVLLPHFIGNQHVNEFIQSHGNNRQAYDKYRREHLAALAGQAIGD